MQPVRGMTGRCADTLPRINQPVAQMLRHLIFRDQPIGQRPSRCSALPWPAQT